MRQRRDANRFVVCKRGLTPFVVALQQHHGPGGVNYSHTRIIQASLTTLNCGLIRKNEKNISAIEKEAQKESRVSGKNVFKDRKTNNCPSSAERPKKTQRVEGM